MSGNNMKFLIVICTAVLLLSSCGSGKRSTDTIARKPQPKIEKPTVQEVDTIYWTEIDKESEYEKAIEEILMDKRDSYSVKLLFPFEIAKNNKADIYKPETKLGRMVHYYAGVQLALEQLDKEGVTLDVEVIDAESGRFDNKLQYCKEADVIIGPRDSDQLAVVANFGKVNEIPVVSPWKSGAKISTDNPYFIQLKPGLVDHFKKLVDYAVNAHALDDIYILGRKNKREDLTYFRYFQAIAAEILDTDNSKPLQEFYVSEDSLVFGETAFDSLFTEGEKHCLILPHWSFSSDEDFVYNVARKLNGERGMHEIYLYGMPILFESEKLTFDLYRSLNMHICRSSYVDRNSAVTDVFRKAYFDAYRDFPSEEAYEAYDMMLYIGRSLHNFGKGFQYFLDSNTSSLLQTNYDIQKVYGDGDDFESIQYFQNKHLFILAFENDHFVAY